MHCLRSITVVTFLTQKFHSFNSDVVPYRRVMIYVVAGSDSQSGGMDARAVNQYSSIRPFRGGTQTVDAIGGPHQPFDPRGLIYTGALHVTGVCACVCVCVIKCLTARGRLTHAPITAV